MTKKEKEETKCWEDVKRLSPIDQMKYEIADELGLVEQVFAQGWGSLTSQQSGKIGGILKNRK